MVKREKDLINEFRKKSGNYKELSSFAEKNLYNLSWSKQKKIMNKAFDKL